jgi:hypothetical protein
VKTNTLVLVFAVARLYRRGDYRRSKHPRLHQKVVRSRGRLNGSLGVSRSANSDSPGPMSSSRARQRVRGRVTNWPLPQRMPVPIRSTGRVGAWAPVDLFGDRALPLAAPTGNSRRLKNGAGARAVIRRACLCLTVFARASTGSILESDRSPERQPSGEVRLALRAPWRNERESCEVSSRPSRVGSIEGSARAAGRCRASRAPEANALERERSLLKT